MTRNVFRNLLANGQQQKSPQKSKNLSNRDEELGSKLYPTSIQANFPQGVDILRWSGYISKAVEGNSHTEPTKVAPEANLETLNLDNYIV
jgi:hypothetical protein